MERIGKAVSRRNNLGSKEAKYVPKLNAPWHKIYNGMSAPANEVLDMTGFMAAPMTIKNTANAKKPHFCKL